MARLLLPLILISIFLEILFLPESVNAAGVSFGSNLLVSDQVSTFSGNHDGPPILDVDFAKGVYIAWTDHRDGKDEIYFSSLDKTANSFSKNIPISGNTNTKSFPQIEEDNGAIYVAWNENQFTVPYGPHIILAKSTDKGQTFSKTSIDSGSSLPISMVARDGNIYISYSISQGSYFELWVAKSIDDGATFTKTKITNSTQSGYYPQRPAIDFFQNNLYLFWLDNRKNGGFEIFFTRSTDGGVTFPEQKSVFNNPNSRMYLFGNGFGRLSERATNNSVFLAFDFYLKTGYEVYFIKSEDNGNTFSAAKSFSEPQQNTILQSPSLTILSDNSPAIAWIERTTSGDQNIKFSYSKDKGNTFEPNIRINNTTASHAFKPSIVADGENNIHLVRLEGSLQPSGIWYTKINTGILPSPSPPPAPTPFLDLPWDYKEKGKSFEQAALDPFSWFDHQYPLQNFCCEPPVMKYTGEVKNEFYRSHNGYDYASKNGVFLNTPVLAAAAGQATFKSWQNSAGAGNLIKIDHGNGYQSWYEHLSEECVIICEEGQQVFVNKGQEIGRVGMTGNTTGPHIHFSVFKDTDNDGSFDDEFSLGATDPLGWEGEPGQDPWPKDKGGAASFNLFIERAQPQSVNIPISGGNLANNKVNINVPSDSSNEAFNLTFKNGPFDIKSLLIKSVVPSFFLNAIDNLGQKITQFSQPINISYDYSEADLSNIIEDSLKLYSFNEQINEWEPINTLLDKVNKIASGETLHFSQFALMGEAKDLIAPTTDTVITGDKGQDNWYRSNVTVNLIAQDNEGGIGLRYTLYTLNGNDWIEYTGPLEFNNEGHYKITYQSFDKAENTEERKTLEFDIDKTTPEVKIYIDQTQQDIVLVGVDGNTTSVVKISNSKSKAIYEISDTAGNTLVLDVRDFDRKKLDKFKIYSLKYNLDPNINLPNNYYRVSYNGKPDQLKVKQETFEINSQVKIKITYDKKQNKSTIFTLQNNKLKQKEIKDGLVLLQLTTNKGNLEYSY